MTTQRETPMQTAATSTEFSVFLPFGKVDKQGDGTLLVHTYLNDETVDDQGEIVDFGAVEKASVAYMQWANVREQHQDDTAAGTMISLTPDPVARTHEAILHIVDPVAVLKVQTGVYKGSSLGGFKRRIRLQKAAGGETVRRIMEIDWRETSLVDRPSRPKARLTLLKRSDGGDPPELIEETLMDNDPETPLAKASDTTTDPEVQQGAATAPTAGIDVHTGPDGAVLAKATESPVEPVVAAPVEPTVEAPVAEPLAKSAADDLSTVGYAISCVARLIENEVADGDADQLAALKEAIAALQRFAAGEADELGTPENAADVADEAAEMTAMAYGAKGGDLHATITTIIEEVLAKRADSASPDPAPITEPDPTTVDVGELLRKTTSYIDEQFARYVSRPELEAMKGEVLGALTPMSETLAKIASFPAPGGPLRFAADGDRFAESGGPTNEAEVLVKASKATSDPHLREELGRLAAAAQIAADRRTS